LEIEIMAILKANQEFCDKCKKPYVAFDGREECNCSNGDKIKTGRTSRGA